MDHFVGRKEWLSRFQEYLNQEGGCWWRITGPPGIGKSSLLRHFERDCEEREHPNAWLDVENPEGRREFTRGADILAELVRSARFFDAEKSGKSLREKAGEAAVWADGAIGKVADASKPLDPTGGLIAGGAKALLALATGLLGKNAQLSEEAAQSRPEWFLLQALISAGERRPVCLVDTYEHCLRKNLMVRSRLDFGHLPPREVGERERPLAEWLSSLFACLEKNGWRIVVAGREMPRSREDDRLQHFTREEILAAARKRPALASYLPAREEPMARILATLSFDGNPLWLQVSMNLLEQLLAQGEDLAELARDPRALHARFEEDNPFDLGQYEGIEHGSSKLAMMQTLTRPIENLEDQAWRIALPRILDQNLVNTLFPPQQARQLLHNFQIAGVFRTSRDHFTLHEEIRDLLLAYARSKGWLETREVRDLHHALWTAINRRYLRAEDGNIESAIQAALENTTDLERHFPPLWLLEATYHRCLSGVGLDATKFQPTDLANALLGSASISVIEKWAISIMLPKRTIALIDELIEVIGKESGLWRSLFGEAVSGMLISDIANGKLFDLKHDSGYWKRKVKCHGLAGHYFGLILSLMNAEQHERLLETVDEMLWRYGEVDSTEVQTQCAKALGNKGVTLGLMNDPQGEVAAYDELLRRFGEVESVEVQTQCATALLTKGMTLEQMNDLQGAVAAYDELLWRYGEVDSADVQARCVKALVYKGVTLGQMNDPQGAVAVYDELLWRYSEVESTEAQTQCAKALLFKGITLRRLLNDPQGAIAVYDELLRRYGEVDSTEVQEPCARALVNKGATLGQMNDLKGAVAVFDEVVTRHGDSRDPEIQAQCLSALSNSAELLLSLGHYEVATDRMRAVLARVGPADQESAIMPFLLWLAEADTTLEDVLAAISTLKAEVSFTWGFDEVHPIINKLPEARRAQARCLVAFFEQHHDFAWLETCLHEGE